MTALEYVIDSAVGRRLENMVEQTLVNDGPDSELLQDLYDRLDELDPSTFEARASTILVGLGFKPAGASLADGGSTIDKKTKDMSGGWRMRVALSKALFLSPSILLLDEPTNHLDLGACVWLEEYLSTYPKILVYLPFPGLLNGVCTHTMVMQQQKLKYWTGNYDTYVKTRNDQDVNTIKLYKKQQEESHILRNLLLSAVVRTRILCVRPNLDKRFWIRWRKTV